MKILLLLFLFSASAFGKDCTKHPIFCQIVKNKKGINKKYAMELSNVIYKMHRKYHIPSRIFTAILMQESGYKLGAKGCHSGIQQPSKKYMETAKDTCLYNKPEEPKKRALGCMHRNFRLTTYKEEAKICTDFGISQIYYKTAKRWEFDIDKLTDDLEYSVESGAKVLHDIMERFEAKDTDYWVRYNCGFKGTTKRDTCRIYKKLVERYL